MKVKYARVSTEGQNVARQLTNGEADYIDVCSGGVAFKDREQGWRLMHMDNRITDIVVHSIDRLGRNTIDIMQTIQFFTNKGINIISEKEGLQTLIDGKENPVAKMMIGILGTLAEFELTRIKERQAEGIAKAKTKGTYAGRQVGSTESSETFANKKGTQDILKYLRQGYSISKTAKLSSTSTGTVKKVKKMIREGVLSI